MGPDHVLVPDKIRPSWSRVRVTWWGSSLDVLVCSHKVVPSQVNTTCSTTVAP